MMIRSRMKFMLSDSCPTVVPSGFGTSLIYFVSVVLYRLDLMKAVSDDVNNRGEYLGLN